MKVQCRVRVDLPANDKAMLKRMKKEFKKFKLWKVEVSEIEETEDDDIRTDGEETLVHCFLTRVVKFTSSDLSTSYDESMTDHLEEEVGSNGYNAGISGQVWRVTGAYVPVHIWWTVVLEDRDGDAVFESEKDLFHAIIPTPLFQLAEVADE